MTLLLTVCIWMFLIGTLLQEPEFMNRALILIGLGLFVAFIIKRVKFEREAKNNAGSTMTFKQALAPLIKADKMYRGIKYNLIFVIIVALLPIISLKFLATDESKASIRDQLLAERYGRICAKNKGITGIEISPWGVDKYAGKIYTVEGTGYIRDGVKYAQSIVESQIKGRNEVYGVAKALGDSDVTGVKFKCRVNIKTHKKEFISAEPR